MTCIWFRLFEIVRLNSCIPELCNRVISAKKILAVLQSAIKSVVGRKSELP